MKRSIVENQRIGMGMGVSMEIGFIEGHFLESK